LSFYVHCYHRRHQVGDVLICARAESAKNWKFGFNLRSEVSGKFPTNYVTLTEVPANYKTPSPNALRPSRDAVSNSSPDNPKKSSSTSPSAEERLAKQAREMIAEARASSNCSAPPGRDGATVFRPVAHPTTTTINTDNIPAPATASPEVLVSMSSGCEKNSDRRVSRVNDPASETERKRKKKSRKSRAS
jgi:hypothetical protein